MSNYRVVGFVLSVVMSLSVHAQENYQWNNVAIGAGGFVSAIIPSTAEPGLIYARTDVGGAYRWHADEERWIPLNDWVTDEQTGLLGIESLALDPQHPERVYMLAGISYFNNGRTAFLRSDDYGESFDVIEVTSQFWTHGNGIGRQNGERLQVDPNNSDILYVGTRGNGLFKSTDRGDTWHRLDGLDITTTPNENGISVVLLDAEDSVAGSTQTLYVGVSRYTEEGPNLYVSHDAGETFTPVSGAPDNHMPQRAVLSDEGQLYIAYGNGAGPHGHWALNEPMEAGAVWRLDTETGAWANVTPSGQTRAFGGISIDPMNSQRLIVSTINNWQPQNGSHGDRFYLSGNGGQSWTDVVARGFSMDNQGVSWIVGHAIHWAGSIEFDPYNEGRVWVTSGNGVFRNDDIDSSDVWKFTVAGLEETVPLGLVSIPDGPLVSVIGDYDGFIHDDVTEYAPIHNPQIGTTTGLAVAAQNSHNIVRVGNDMYYSTDQGLSWTKTSNMNGNQGHVALSADGAVLLHSPNNSSTTYRSTDWGTSWSSVSGLNINNARPVADPVNANKFYVYGGGSLRVSNDGGQSFSQAANLGSDGYSLIRPVPSREGDIWVAMANGGLSRSTDGGTSFNSIASVSQASAVGFGKAAPGSDYPTVYIWGTVDGVRGIHRSIDVGASWVRVNDDDHQYGGPGNGEFVVGDMNHFGRVYMSTAGRGIVYGEPENSVDPDPGESGGDDSNDDADSGNGNPAPGNGESSGSSSSGSAGLGIVLLLLFLWARSLRPRLSRT